VLNHRSQKCAAQNLTLHQVLYRGLPDQGLKQKVTEIRFFLRLVCFAAPDWVAKYASYSSLECLLDERFKRIFACFLQ